MLLGHGDAVMTSAGFEDAVAIQPELGGEQKSVFTHVINDEYDGWFFVGLVHNTIHLMNGHLPMVKINSARIRLVTLQLHGRFQRACVLLVVKRTL